MPSRAALAAVAVAMLCAAALATVVARFGPAPAAEVAGGGETAFTSEVHRREMGPGRDPQRWMGSRASFVFRDLSPGPAVVEVRVRGQRTSVLVAVDGVVVGTIEPGQTTVAVPLPRLPGGDHVVELRTDGFESGDGRRLGALVDSVTVRATAAARPSARLLLLFVIPAALVATAALLAGLPPAAALATVIEASAAQALLLWPQGLLHSSYASSLAALLGVGGLGALAFARWREKHVSGAGPWAFAAFLAALLVQVLAATSPLMIVSDEVFHANNLGRVAGGQWFLTSVTQHARPFHFPYGVSFYALLVPWLRAGVDAVALVRGAAAVSGLAASVGLFALLAPTGPARAGLAVILLQLLPGAFDPYSFGNLSNVFGQSMTTLFFCWWAGPGSAERSRSESERGFTPRERKPPGGWPTGAVLLALGCLAHFSSLVVLAVLLAALWVVRGREGPGRLRVTAAACGLGVAALYYARFVPLMVEQLPRLLEGGGQGRGASRGTLDVLRLQLLGILGQWGLPAIILAVVGRPRWRASPLDRDLVAYWAAGAVLALPAMFTPVDVRYLYALTVPLAAAGGAALGKLREGGRGGALAAALLLGAQAAWGLRGLVEAVAQRYR
jgi:hypothetical protein